MILRGSGLHEMTDASLELFRAKEFAKKTGVTVRALHHYDRIGLLKPAALSQNGYRLYGKNELLRLERIVALKFIGLPLDQIKELLSNDAADVSTALSVQRQSVEKMRAHLDMVLHAIARAEAEIRAAEQSEWDALKKVIELMELRENMEWVKKYYTEDQLANLRSRATPETLAAAEQEWKTLIAEVEAARNEDPANEKAQALAQRWRALVGQFTGGDPGIAQNLGRLYADQANWPADFKKPYSDEAGDFITRAIAVRDAL